MVAPSHAPLATEVDRLDLLPLMPDPAPTLVGPVQFGPILKGTCLLTLDGLHSELNVFGPIRLRRCNGQWVVAVVGELKDRLDAYEAKELAARQAAGHSVVEGR